MERDVVRRRSRLALLLLIPVTLLVVGLGTYVWAETWFRKPLAALREPQVIDIPAGEPLLRVARRLAIAPGIALEHPRLWTWFAQWQGQAAHVRAGEYALEVGLTPAELLQQLVEGRVLLHPVTLVDGWTLGAVRATLDSNDVLRHELTGLSEPQLMARLGIDAPAAEGEFFPDTYLVPRGTTDREILRMAHERLVARLTSVWQTRRPDSTVHSPYELLILASLIEKETADPSERALIAAVFMNRLRQGMRLQTDPTVIYGLGAQYDGHLHHRDLVTDTPYNTYTRAGLPPTPIALASEAALAAAASPADTEALYFVATGRGDGRHVFSKTLSAHQQAVQHYLREQRARPQRP